MKSHNFNRFGPKRKIVPRKGFLERLEGRALMAGLSDDFVVNQATMGMAEGEIGGVDDKPHQFDASPAFKYLPTHYVATGKNGDLMGRPASGTPLQIALAFLSENASQFGLKASDFTHAIVKDQYPTPDLGTTHIFLKQTFNGLEIANADLSIHVARDGRIVNVSSTFVPNLNHPPQNQTPVPGISASAALSKFAEAIGGTNQVGPTTTSPSSGPSQNTVISNSVVAAGNVNANLQYVATSTGVQLAWRLNYLTAAKDHWFDVSVSASNGALLYYADYVDNATYNVFPLPVSSPSTGSRALVVDPQDPIASPYGWHDVNGLPGPDFTDTRGNNVFAQEDRDNTALPGGGRSATTRPNGGLNLVFDFPLNLVATNPSAYTNAAVVNLFYVTNIAHDITFRHGFDEPSGNFQSLNYSRTGRGGDQVIALAQQNGNALLPINNAFFATPPDGFEPLMIMGEFNLDISALYEPGPQPLPTYTPRRDSDLVGDVILHEYFHGVSNRLTGGPNNVLALNAIQSGSMGEGWSDFFATWATQRPTDLRDTPRPAGTYLEGPSPRNPGTGIRRFPYNFDLAQNPLTFGDFNGGLTGNIPNDEVHAAGEIWASILWDLNWLMIDRYGYDSDLNNGKAGNNLAFQMVMDGLKLNPVNPTFTEARDAILAGDRLRNQGVNQDVIWQAFARRGMGASADSDALDLGISIGPTGIVFIDSPNSNQVRESFDLPNSPGLIKGSVFRDDDGDGIQDGAETNLAGWTIYIDLNNSGTLDRQEPTTLTDANGDYVFTFYVPGRFTIGALVKPNFAQTTPTGRGTQTVTIIPGQTVQDIDFGFRSALSTTKGFKWNDLNADGIRDPNEPGQPGVWIYVDLDADGRLDLGEPSAITDGDGAYQLILDKVGTFNVREVIPPGFEQTFPGTDNPPSVTLIRGSVNVNVSFGNRGILDYGDAPASFGTLAANNGAVHGILKGFYLGAQVDAEGDGNPSVAANGDDISLLADEDGVVFNGDLASGQDASVSVIVHTGGFSAGKLQGWVDFNRDGDFNDAGEQIFKNVKLQSGTHTQTFRVPDNALPGLSYARFRYGYEQDLGPTGRAMAGEVEDYRVRILDNRPDANDDQFSVIQNTTANLLDVLANDIPSSRGPLTIINVSSASERGAVTIATNRRELRYTPRPGFFGTETFTYTVSDGFGGTDTAGVAVTVLPAFENPIAVDDSFDVTAGSRNSPLDVLFNDLPGRRGPITLVQVTQPSNGLVTLDNRNTSDPSDDLVRYEPNAGFQGTEQFDYTIENAIGVRDSAQVTVHVLPGSLDNDKVQIRLEATDLNGNPIAAITQGQDFILRVHVKDLRSNDEIDDNVDRRGVFAAYFDLLYNFRLVAPTGDVTFVSPFTNFKSGDDLVPGLIDELGAFSNSSEPLGDAEFLLATLPLRANGFGEAVFKGDPADIIPDHDVLLFEPPTPPVQFDEIRFIGTSVVIVGAGGIPIALDNTFTLAANSNNNILDVLANDIEEDNPPLIITGVSVPSNGGVVAIGVGGQNLRYTPRPGFNGTEQFTYTVRNAVGLTDTATVTVQVGNPNRDVRLRLETTDANGSVITRTPRGSTYELRAYVKDIRTLPPVDAGVYAAYFDLLYDAGFTSPVSDSSNPFGIDIVFGPQYNQNGLSAMAGIDGIIDEAGAFQTSFGPLGTSEFLLFTVSFNADREGRAQFAADPAEEARHDTLLYEPPQAVPVPKILYGSTSITIGAGGNATAPIAVDNIFSVAANSAANVLAVLVNDRANDPAGATVTAVGTTSQGGIATPAPNGTSLTYTPRAGFVGLDQFSYTIRNSSGLTSSATVSVVVGNSPKDVNFRLQTTDLNGNPINQITAGSDFLVRFLVQDIRSAQVDAGLFAAYTDVLYDSTLTSVISAPANPLGFDITFSPNYPNGRSGDARTPNLLNETGSFQSSLDPLGSDELLVYSVRLHANAAGTIKFETDPADIFPSHDTLLYNTPSSAVQLSRIAFGSTTITITGGSGEGEFTNRRNKLDVNSNGTVEPRDVLLVVNALNSMGAKRLTASDFTSLRAAGEGPANVRSAHTIPYYPDTNSDRHLTSLDALLVINYLNALTGHSGENVTSATRAPAVVAPIPINATARVIAEAEASPQAARNSVERTSPSTSNTSTSSASSSNTSSLQRLLGSASRSAIVSPQARISIAQSAARSFSPASIEDLLTEDLAADVRRGWDQQRE